MAKVDKKKIVKDEEYLFRYADDLMTELTGHVISIRNVSGARHALNYLKDLTRRTMFLDILSHISKDPDILDEKRKRIGEIRKFLKNIIYKAEVTQKDVEEFRKNMGDLSNYINMAQSKYERMLRINDKPKRHEGSITIALLFFIIIILGLVFFFIRYFYR